MRKFKLIKEYPGSPELGTVRSDENKLVEWKGYNFYTEYPEYWEEISIDVFYMVATKLDALFNMCEPIMVVNFDTSKYNNSYKFFRDKKEAIDFIVQNKPCFSLEDINKEISTDNSKFRMLHNFSEISKSRI